MKDSAKRIALAALFAALVSGGKLALMFIPNVEVVSILLAVAGYCFGALFSLSVSLVFCTVETALWGFNTWVILYFVYWPLVSLLFGLIGKSRLKNRWVTAGLAAAMTFFFGVLSSVIDTLIAFGGGGFVFNGEDFFSAVRHTLRKGNRIFCSAHCIQLYSFRTAVQTAVRVGEQT